jgi:hypothetical protein
VTLMMLLPTTTATCLALWLNTLVWLTAPLTYWFTDRSRFKTGTSRCPRQRYLSYHAGPTGYGLTARRESLPLVTGIGVHRVLEGFSRILQQHDRLPALAETRAVIAEAQADYLGRVDARGYRGILDSEHTRETVEEQGSLIAGLGWVLRLKFLPWLHQQYRVLKVEEERLHMLGDEQALMLRTDLLAQRRGAQSLAYFECKTTGWESEAWAEQWETDPQLALGTVDARELWGAEVTELYIVGLNKGRRQKDRYDPEGRKRQMSPLCYGYRRESNPPLQAEDWLPAYEWVTNDGDTKRASRAHKRTSITALDHSDWPTYQAYKHQDPELSAPEFWTRMLPNSLLDKVCFILGPMNRQDQQLVSVLRSMAGEESRWQRILWELWEVQMRDGHAWSSDAFQAALDERIPCSWACRPFGREHQCEFVPICHRHVGWDDPLGSGQYQPRLPHHNPELQQAIERGLLPEQSGAVEEEE